MACRLTNLSGNKTTAKGSRDCFPNAKSVLEREGEKKSERERKRGRERKRMSE